MTRTRHWGALCAAGAMALPCFSGQGGPYATTKGAIRGATAADDRTALATLYCALMSDLMLTRMGATRGDLIVEGTFAGNLAFGQTLGALRPTQRVFAAEDTAGTARGNEGKRDQENRLMSSPGTIARVGPDRTSGSSPSGKGSLRNRRAD